MSSSTEQTAPDVSLRANKVIAASAGHMVHDIFTAFLPPLLPLIIAEFSLSMFQAGVLNVLAVLAFYFNPLLGMLVDRVNLRLLFVAAPGLVAVCMSLIGAAPSYWAVCLLLLFTGIGSAAYHTIGPVFITRAAGSQLGRGMSFFMVGGESARTLAYWPDMEADLPQLKYEPSSKVIDLPPGDRGYGKTAIIAIDAPKEA